MINVSEFKQDILTHGIFDPEGVHHEFAFGNHGRKLDFDLIEEGSYLYDDWIGIASQAAVDEFETEPIAILGIANGTNRVARDVAAKLELPALYTVKTGPGEVALTEESRKLLKKLGSGVVRFIEDVGTSGGTAYSAVQSAYEAGAQEIDGLFTWKRRTNIEVFEANKIPYCAIIDDPQPTYTPGECEDVGYCSLGWKLIPYKR